MPKYTKSLFQQWTEEEPSVVESPVERGLRTAAKWLGLDQALDPVTTELGPAAPLITMFKNKAARELGTQAYLDAAKKLGSPALEEASQRFAAQYPRVAAHTNLVTEPTVGNYSARVRPRRKFFSEDSPVTMEVSPSGMQAMGDPVMGVPNALDMVYHEGTHVAQNLGNKDLGALYQLANDAVGYDRNPFEVSAYNISGAASKGQARPKYPYNAIEGLKQIVKDPNVAFKSGQSAWAQREMQDILHDRTQTARKGFRNKGVTGITGK